VCVCVWGRRCRAVTVKSEVDALGCLSNPGAWDVVDFCSVQPGQTAVCLRPVRLGSESINRSTNQTTTPTTSSKKCDTTPSAACVVPVTRK
jgi:hypothetical protein